MLTKKPYSWDEIRTNDKNTDWYKVQSRSSQEIALHAVIDKIVSGEIPQYKQVELIPSSLWTKYNVQITKAFEFYTKKIASDPNRKISTLYFSGSTCTGKTTVAKLWCEKLGLSYYVSSASNDVMQGYEGQDVLILDDFRGDMEKKGSSRSFNLPDFLKMTDQNTRSSIKSRYSNKDFIGSYIIITSSRPIYDMYFNLDVEDKHQLFRRVSSQYQFTKDKIYLSAYSQEFHKYLPIGSMSNPAAGIYSEEMPLQCFVNLADSFGTVVTPFEPELNAVSAFTNWYDSEDGKRFLAAKEAYLSSRVAFVGDDKTGLDKFGGV
jgi:RNA helicase.